MLRTLMLLTLVVGALVVLAAESPERRRDLLDQGAALVGTTVREARAAGAALVERGRRRAAGGGPEALRDLRDQGIVTDEFVARRGAGAMQQAPPAATPTPAPAPVNRRDPSGWSDAEYERAKRHLLDALRRLEGPGHAD